jgi:outer membrane protein
MKIYAESNKVELILSYTRGGAVWYATDALDITPSIIEGLNKEYLSSPSDSIKSTK